MKLVINPITGKQELVINDYDELINKPTINDLLPDQTGQTGKVLGSNGTSALWVNQTTGDGTFGNIECGFPDSTYGAVNPIDCGGVT